MIYHCEICHTKCVNLRNGDNSETCLSRLVCLFDTLLRNGKILKNMSFTIFIQCSLHNKIGIGI